MASLDPVWRERYAGDLAADMHSEDMLLLKCYMIAIVVFWLVLMQRLFS